MRIFYALKYRTKSGMVVNEDRWFKDHRSMERWMQKRGYEMVAFSVLKVKDGNANPEE